MNFPRETALTNDTLPSDSASASAASLVSSVASAAQTPSLARAVSLNDTNSSVQSDQQSASALASASSSGASAASSASHSDPPASSSSHSSPKSSSQPQPSSSASPPSSSGPSASSSASQSASPSSSATLTLLLSASASVPDPSAITGSANVTTILSTESDGQVVTITTSFPTSLSTAPSSVTAAQRTAIIAGATAGGVGLVLFLLAAVFVYKRHKSRKQEFSEAVGRVRREAHGAGAMGLLDEEGFDDDDAVPMRRYRDDAASHSRSLTSLGPPQSPAPSLFRQRAETGSVFREEGVWPPPQGTHFVDPLVGVGTGEGLGHIIDDVMGPAEPTHAKDRGNIPSMSSATSSMYADPFRDISHASAPSDPSLYFDRRGASSSMSTHSQQTSGAHSQQTSGSRPATPQSLLGLPAGAAGTPKKPSPLAHPVNPPSSATWLTRSPKKPGTRLSESSEG
ncbi:hypothetical protein C8F04DRAFT_1388266 [Mycena alexandri]|uniref:Uncharacterized protein n=1 Tax=Mycena alexandri TaxID=1745969 RepID=A0AAD6TGC5_9AGAR|nr:hypothetical protein C8F04DRAFT_1388266 [Mycena alexandri]